MPEDGKPGEDLPVSQDELIRRQALASKRNAAMDTMSNTVRKQDEARRGIVDKLR